MSENGELQRKDSERSIYVLLFVVFIMGLIFALSLPIQTRVENIYETLGKPTNEFDEMLSKIKKDINQEDIEIKVIIGDFYNYGFGLGSLETSFHPTYYILLDSNLFYNELNPDERKALVAHEAGHILFRGVRDGDRTAQTNTQVAADTFAARYVHPKHLISLLDKLYADHVIRVENLKKLDPEK